jgi:hypothetical protein
MQLSAADVLAVHVFPSICPLFLFSGSGTSATSTVRLVLASVGLCLGWQCAAHLRGCVHLASSASALTDASLTPACVSWGTAWRQDGGCKLYICALTSRACCRMYAGIDDGPR